jgi:anti-anti-sigma regulatory factor
VTRNAARAARTGASARPGSATRPTYEWESPRGGGITLKLYGTLGRHELRRVVDAVLERTQSPRGLLAVDFEEVAHLDYRALPEFAAALGRQRDRGASIWLVGLNPYLRCLFQVAGQGPLARQLEWGAAWSTTETIH